MGDLVELIQGGNRQVYFAFYQGFQVRLRRVDPRQNSRTPRRGQVMVSVFVQPRTHHRAGGSGREMIASHTLRIQVLTQLISLRALGYPEPLHPRFQRRQRQAFHSVSVSIGLHNRHLLGTRRESAHIYQILTVGAEVNDHANWPARIICFNHIHPFCATNPNPIFSLFTNRCRLPGEVRRELEVSPQ